MSSSKTDDNYYKRADEVITLANKQCDDITPTKVNLSLMFASARFSAFITATLAHDLDELKRDKEEAVKYFTEQFTQMLNENLDENIKNYQRDN